MIPMYGVGDEDAKGYNKAPYGNSNGAQYYGNVAGSNGGGPLGLIYRLKELASGWMRLILSDKNSRNIFFFLLINFSFAFVELFYGMWTNSLGLISDSFHMFFDCTALLTGLFASVITKWKSNDRFSYGYVRAEILSGFVNGLFLLFIAFFIFSEAVERVFEPPNVHHERLFLVSVMGLIVNLVGIFVFQHGHADGCSHGHSHGGHSHGSHSHKHHDDLSSTSLIPEEPLSFVTTSSPGINGHASHNHGHNHGHSHGHDHHHEHDHSHGHSHGHDHGHSHGGGGNQIIQGVFLHILADTLGSVGVIISALLMSQFGWMIADPICSMFIAVLVVLSTYPLLRDSGAILMQRTPVQLQDKLPSCYQKVMSLSGVLSVQETHFWTLCSDRYVGNLKLEVSHEADFRQLIMHCQSIFAQIGIKQLYVQVDLAHS